MESSNNSLWFIFEVLEQICINLLVKQKLKVPACLAWGAFTCNTVWPHGKCRPTALRSVSDLFQPLSYDRCISVLIHRLWTGCYNLAMGCYHWQWSAIDGNSWGWYQCEQFYRQHGLVWNFHMTWAVTDIFDYWLLQLALALCKHGSRRLVIYQLLSTYLFQ